MARDWIVSFQEVERQWETIDPVGPEYVASVGECDEAKRIVNTG